MNATVMTSMTQQSFDVLQIMNAAAQQAYVNLQIMLPPTSFQGPCVGSGCN